MAGHEREAQLEFIGTADEVICQYGPRGLIFRYISGDIKQLVTERDGDTWCKYCKRSDFRMEFHHIDHQIAMRGRLDTIERICADCNSKFERDEPPSYLLRVA